MQFRLLVPFFVGLSLGALTTHFVSLATRSTYPLATDAIYADSSIETAAWTVTTAGPDETATPCPPAQVLSKSSASSQSDIPGELFSRVRILCLIMTHAGNYATKAVAVNNTWARRCNRYAFVGSNATKLDIPLIRLNLTDAYGNLWQKVWMSLDYVERNFNLSDFDFVLKADDDTYVVMENLRLLLLPLDPGQPTQLGRQFIYDKDERQQYMSGGAGYVLSRAAVQLFIKRAVRAGRKSKACDLDYRVAEDWMMGTCITSLGVKLVKSLDSGGLERFHPLNPEYMIGWGPAEMPPWMWSMNYYKFRACLRNCISSATVSFHYISNMYLVEFLLYGMRPVGVDPIAANETLALGENGK